jgi:hypothetical protein
MRTECYILNGFSERWPSSAAIEGRIAIATVTHVHDETLPVRSRIGWGPILAGVAVAFAVYFLLSLLGAAIGLSVADDLQRDSLGMGAAIWAVLTVIVAMFIGGWVTTRCTVGEDTLEAALYGAILWGVMFLLLLWLIGSGIGMGFNALVTAQANNGQQQAAQATGAAAAQQTPEMSERTRQTASEAAWWSFAGTLLSMGAAIGGALVGTGGRHRREIHTTRTAATPGTIHHPTV